MHYALADIIKFSADVERECNTGIPARYSQELWETNIDYVVQCQTQLTSQATKKNLEYYAQAINLAAQYLRWEEESIRKTSNEILVLLSEHLSELNRFSQTLLPESQLTLPKPIDEETYYISKEEFFEKIKDIYIEPASKKPDEEEPLEGKSCIPTQFSSALSFQVLGGFIAVFGVVAVAVAFAALSGATLGIAAAVGITVTLAGIGLFGAGTYKHYKENCTIDELSVDEAPYSQTLGAS
ncbi:hypothetical protein BN59_02994 [Legionella massiliensis]|uniref:Uncharacterized protein n=1 Tax=Legionella massiliensis TaxID=1034943 RepID=A0A078L086_9GAMM|nr:hypothetical protein [Legionella massiliensis]CDZ78682.1 hypothetical protein BN59_02994 [Legionella massiliensis]CEE14420.1 hypothetical protein BN1094_02994 [Legionella massiliensis]